jgi:Gpi18-like mannosyltransferase
MIILSGMILADTLFLFLFSLFILFALYYFRFLTKTYLFLTIFFLSIATLVRPVSYFLIVLLLPLVIVALVWSGMKLKQILYRIFIYLSTVAIILGPIHYRNYDQYNSFLLVSQGGSHALKWIVPAVYQYSGQGSYQEGQLLAENHFKDAIHRNNFKISSNNPFENSSYQMQVANELIVELGLLNVLHAWSTGIVMNLLAPSVAYAPIIRAIEHPSFYKTNGNGLVEKLINYSMNISNLLYLLIIITGTMVSLIFLIISMFSFYKMIKSKRFEGKNRGILLFLLFIILYFMIITGPIIGVKYRLPIEPIMAVFFAYALIGFRKEKEKEKEKEKYNK